MVSFADFSPRSAEFKRARAGLSEFLCVRHTMTARSQYAETEEAGAAGKPP